MDTKVFSTKSEIRVKDKRPHVDGTYIIGLDMGYSGPKCYHEDGNFVFPNFCKKISKDIFGELTKNDIIYENIANGDKYCVGTMAVKSLDEDSVVAEDALFGRNHYLHPDFKVMLETSLGIALWNHPTDGTDVFVQTGLPPAYIVKDTPYLKSVIKGNHSFAVTIGSERKVFDITIAEDAIDVMVQPMGTLNSLLFDENGKRVPNAMDIMRSDILIFDGGFGTLDTFLVKANQIESMNTDANLGMRRVMAETRDLIKKDLGVNVSVPAMQNVLRSGYVEVNDYVNLRKDRVDVSTYLEKANALVSAEALESIKDYVFKIKYLIMTGGTGEAWYNIFSERLSGLGINVLSGKQNSNLPTVYSNARGYYYYRLRKLGFKG